MKIERHWKDGKLTSLKIDDIPQPLPQVSAISPPAASPIGYPTKGVATSTLQPGSIFSLIILKITGQRTANCGSCGRRKKQMNQWGWWGCWKNRKIIVGWLVEEARKRGHPIEAQSAFALFKAAFREMAV